MSPIEALEVEEILAELEYPGELFLQFDLEEPECYRVLVIALWMDPASALVTGEVLLDVTVEKEEFTR